jgi:hypothetical protein
MRSTQLSALVLVAALATASAAEPPPPKDWEVEITPYAWVPDLDGSVETRNGTEHFHVGMDDVLENLDVAAMGRVSVRWRRWVGVVDGVWSVLEQDDAFQRGPLQVDANVRQTMVLAQALAGYRLYARPGGLFGHAAPGDERVFGFDVLAGVNYTYVSASLELERDPVGPLAGNDRHFGNSNDWFAPAVGLRVQNDFTERLRLENLASVGGFSVGDAPDSSWTITTLLSYRFTDHWLAAVGHRVITADGNEGGDLRMHGPMIGIGYRF